MSESEKATLKARVNGRVQGVGFRASAIRKANQLGLDGWVRNEHDGTVRVVAEGPRPMLEDMVDWLERGPASAHVTSVDAKYSSYRAQYSGFRIEY